MNKGARYTVRTRYGVFSLDEASYRDYLAGRHWITWPPQRDTAAPLRQEPLPPEATAEAVRLRDLADIRGVADTLMGFAIRPEIPCRERMQDIHIHELDLSARSGNGLMRAGIHTYGKLHALIKSDRGIASVRNLGVKSIKEIGDTFLTDCYRRLLPYEKAAFWQEVLDLNKEVHS